MTSHRIHHTEDETQPRLTPDVTSKGPGSQMTSHLGEILLLVPIIIVSKAETALKRVI